MKISPTVTFRGNAVRHGTKKKEVSKHTACELIRTRSTQSHNKRGRIKEEAPVTKTNFTDGCLSERQ